MVNYQYIVTHLRITVFFISDTLFRLSRTCWHLQIEREKHTVGGCDVYITARSVVAWAQISPSATLVLEGPSILGPSPDQINNLGNTTCKNGLHAQEDENHGWWWRWKQMDDGQAGEGTMMDDGWGKREKTETQENTYWNSNLIGSI